MRCDLGYVLFSVQICKDMGEDPRFSSFVGTCLGNHLREHCTRDRSRLSVDPLAHGLPVHTAHRFQGREVVVVTHLDKNSSPRTSVVFVEESGF